MGHCSRAKATSDSLLQSRWSIDMSRRQAAFQLAVRSLRSINITHRDLPHSACPSSRVHAGVVLV